MIRPLAIIVFLMCFFPPPIIADDVVGSRTTLTVDEEDNLTLSLHNSPYSLVEIFGIAPDNDRILQQMFFDAFEVFSGGEACVPDAAVQWSDDVNIDPTLNFTCDDVDELTLKFDGTVDPAKSQFHRLSIVIDGRMTLAPLPSGDKIMRIPVKLLRARWAEG